MFKSAHAAGEWQDAVVECLRALGSLDEVSGPGFVYATEHHADHLHQIEAALRDGTGIRDWVGSIGMGVVAGARAFFDEPALAVMVADVADGAFAVCPHIAPEDFAGITVPGPPKLLSGPAFGLIHADSRAPGTPALIRALTDQGQGYLVGGLTASNRADHQIANGVTGGGVSGVVFAPDVAVATSLSQGCSPVAGIHEITQCEDNIIVELDGRPAYDVFVDDVGRELAEDLERLAGLIHAAIPVSGSDTGDYLVRNLVGLDAERGLLAIAETVEPGDRLMFVRRDPKAAEEDLRNMTARLVSRAGDAAKGAVYVSCIARGPNTFDGLNKEMEIVAGALGDVPVIGFYANGEISNDRLYAYTGVLTLFL